MSNNNNDSEDTIDYTKINPWNSRDYPVTVNSVRYNQDFSLLTLGTSKGYKIFLTSNLRAAHEPTDAVIKFGDISIAMTYYKSSLVFLLPSRYNKDYSNREIIVFDDFYQSKFASIKDKGEEILNFYVSKNVIFLVTLSKIIVMEIISFKIIDVIDGINSINQLISFNFFDFIAYTELKDKKKILVKYYQNSNYKISSIMKRAIKFNFDYVQTFQLSPSGDTIAIVSIYGNKIHIYYTQNGKLKECLLISQYLQTIDKVFFSEKKSNYLFVLRNDLKFNIYKIGKLQVNNAKCICNKYDDSKVTTEKKEENSGFFGYFRKYSRNRDIKDYHAYSNLEGNILFIDFDRRTNKDIIYINQNGKFIKYHFNKKPSGQLTPILSIQWE